MIYSRDAKMNKIDFLTSRLSQEAHVTNMKMLLVLCMEPSCWAGLWVYSQDLTGWRQQ